MSNTSVELKKIVKEYKSANNKVFRAVDNIDLVVQKGEFITLLGPSGCGKTTTLRMIAGFENPNSGEILIGEKVVNSLTPDKRNTAMVFQSYALFPHYDVYNNISYGLKLKKMPPQDISKKVNEILALVGLSGLETRFPNQLSGGQQQRVALARALIMEPDVLLFDEPLSNLDAKLRVSMRTEIKRIQSRLGITSIYVTHDQSEAMSLSDRIIVMNKGKIEQVGTPQEIYNHPVSQFVADFIGKANFVEAKAEERETEKGVRVRLWNKSVFIEHNQVEGDVVQDGKVTIMIRPESITLSSGSDGYPGVVTMSTFMGNHQEYIIEIEGNQLFVEVTNPNSCHVYKVDDRVNVVINELDLHIVK